MMLLSLSIFLLLLLGSYSIIEAVDNEFLYSPEGRTEICEKKNQDHQKAIIDQFTCIERYQKDIPEDIARLKSCWKEAAGIDYPAKDEDWITNVFCQFPTPYFLKNIASDCFLRKVAEEKTKKYREEKQKENKKVDETDETNREEYDYTKAVAAMIEVSRKKEPSANYSFLNCYEVYDPLDNLAKEYNQGAEVIVALGKVNKAISERKELCPAEAADSIPDTLEKMKCVETSFPENKSVIESCWKDIVYKIPYPKSDEDWKTYLCSGSEKYPLSMLKLVEDCTIYRIAVKDVPDAVNSKDAGKCSVTEDDEMETAYFEKLDNDYEKIRRYNDVCFGNKQSLLEEQEKGSNLFRCLTKSMKDDMTSLKKLMEYCWSLQLKVLSPKTESPATDALPKTDEEWGKSLCSNSPLRQLISIDQGNRCLGELTVIRNRDEPGIPLTSEEKIARLDCGIL